MNTRQCARIAGRLLALCAAVHAADAAAGLPHDIDGNWFNPQQAGHGISIETIGDERALVFWYAYDTAGAPMPLYIEGRIVGHSIVGTALAPRGMRFGTFDPRELRMPAWGRVEVRFSDCGHAELSFDADDPAFRSGRLPLERLARNPSPDCRLDASELGDGIVFGHMQHDAGALTNSGDVWGFVDDGALHAMVHRNRANPGLGWAGGAAVAGSVLIATSADELPGVSVLHTTVLPNGGLCALIGGAADCTHGFGFDAVTLDVPFQHGADGAQSVPSSAGPSLTATVSPFRLHGGIWRGNASTYSFFVTDDLAIRGEMHVAQDGRLCVRRADADGCYYAGRITSETGDHSAFELRRPGSGEPPFTGVATVLGSEPWGPSLIHLVGSNGVTGIGIVGTR